MDYSSEFNPFAKFLCALTKKEEASGDEREDYRGI